MMVTLCPFFVSACATQKPMTAWPPLFVFTIRTLLLSELATTSALVARVHLDRSTGIVIAAVPVICALYANREREPLKLTRETARDTLLEWQAVVLMDGMD